MNRHMNRLKAALVLAAALAGCLTTKDGLILEDNAQGVFVVPVTIRFTIPLGPRGQEGRHDEGTQGQVPSFNSFFENPLSS